MRVNVVKILLVFRNHPGVMNIVMTKVNVEAKWKNFAALRYSMMYVDENLKATWKKGEFNLKKIPW